jgi:fatty acid desaturase
MSTPLPFDPAAVDLDAFLEDLRALRREIDASLGEADLRHLITIERWGHAATALGLLGAGLCPNPVSAVLLSLGRSTRWLLMHHIGHRGYDKVPGVPARYTSKVFARGYRRFLDWPDWMLPEAWIYEHNVLHHAHTSEDRDPDLIERNAESLRSSSIPRAIRYLLVGLLGLTWRASYYAPNTLRVYRERPIASTTAATAATSAASPTDHRRELWLKCYLPYLALNFGALPLAFAPLGPWGVISAFCNSLMAEALTNLHTFCVVGPNHTGDDLPRWDDRPSSRAEHALRQVLCSTNYATGGDLSDYAHLFLNYQIEHHLFPDLPMRQYQRIQPTVRALCEKHGIPYVQQSVFRRFQKMLDVVVGKASMPRGPSAGEGARARATPGAPREREGTVAAAE